MRGGEADVGGTEPPPEPQGRDAPAPPATDPMPSEEPEQSGLWGRVKHWFGR